MGMLLEAGCEKIFQEKISGTIKKRPELLKLIEHLRKDDVVVISDLTRLSRSVKALFQLIDKFESIGANLMSLKESWLDTTTPHGKLLFSIFSGISQFERDIIAQHTKEGIEAARAKGRKGWRPSIDSQKIKVALKMYHSKNHSIEEIIETVGISKPTLYRYIENDKDNKAKNM